MARKKAGVGRTRADDHCLRRLFLLKQILGKKDAAIETIVKELQKANCTGLSLKYIRNDLTLLSKAGWSVRLGDRSLEGGEKEPIVVSEGATFAFLWHDKGSEAAERLDKQSDIKNTLAEALVDDIGKMKDVKWAILGSGTSVHAVARVLFERSDVLGIEGVSTANVFVLHEYIRQKPEMKIEIAGGTLDWATACLLVAHERAYQEGNAAQVVITGFSGLTREGFRTKPIIDVREKEREINPTGESVRCVLIPLEWSKIGAGAHQQLVRFPAKDSIRGFKYVLYTKRPDTPEPEKLAVLDYWKDQLSGKFEVQYLS